METFGMVNLETLGVMHPRFEEVSISRQVMGGSTRFPLLVWGRTHDTQTNLLRLPIEVRNTSDYLRSQAVTPFPWALPR